MSALIDVTIPADQLEGTESVLTRWFVEVGQRVLRGDSLGRIGDTGSIQFAVRYPGSSMVYESEGRLQRWLAGEEQQRTVGVTDRRGLRFG